MSSSLSVQEVKDKLLETSSKSELEQIVSMINLDLAKKNLVRSMIFSDTVDKVLDEMTQRIEKVPGQFSNKDLLDYLNAFETHLSKSSLDNKEIPTIAIQQNIVNVNSPLSQFDRESKDRMRDVLRQILYQPKDNITEDTTIIEGDVLPDESEEIIE